MPAGHGISLNLSRCAKSHGIRVTAVLPSHAALASSSMSDNDMISDLQCASIGFRCRMHYVKVLSVLCCVCHRNDLQCTLLAPKSTLLGLSGSSTATACTVCQAGTYGTGSGPLPFKHLNQPRHHVSSMFSRHTPRQELILAELHTKLWVPLICVRRYATLWM